MKKNVPRLARLILLVMAGFFAANTVIAQSGIFVGGPAYYDRDFSIDELRSSGFTFVVVWTIHVMNTNGDLNYNAEFPIVKNGQYTGNTTYPEFANDMALLKTAPTSINRLEIGLSGWGSSTFDHIKTLVNSEGTGPGSKLYENFKALKEAIPEIDAVNFDDEDTYDAASATAFAVMLADLGYKVTLCPYTRSSYWQSIASNTNSQRPGAVDGVYLQCYAGGAGNNPCSWNIDGLPIWPGLETNSKSAGQVESQLNTWQNQCGITGGWMWLYDHIKNSSAVASYATAINQALDIGMVPGLASNPAPVNGASNISRNADLSWTAGNSATSHNVYLGTSSSLGPVDLKGNQVAISYDPGTLAENSTYYWRIDEVNEQGTTTGETWSFTTGTDLSVSIDHTNPVGTGTISARAEISAGEAATKAFDNLYAPGTQNSNWSKWLDNGGTPSVSNPSWVQIQFPSAVIVDKLVVVSANDDFGRDPKDFNLQGSNDGASWNTLNSWSGQLFTGRFQKKELAFVNTSAYAYYRLNITKNDENVSMTQLCEIELFGPETTISNPPAVANQPSPANGATDVSVTTDLAWTAGSGATSHDVYFGTNPNPGSNEFQNFYTETTFDPGTLAESTTYYWRIDENNSAGTTTGEVWSFTTGSTTPVSVDHTDPVGSGTITARAEIHSNEGAARAFDNLYTSGTQNSSWSKWLDNAGTPSVSDPAWIQIQLPAAVIVDKLVIVSANDDYGRDPKDFNLQGSTDGSSWTTLSNWSNEVFASRFQRREFAFTNSASYSYYRLNITRNDENVGMTQLCEIELYGPQTSGLKAMGVEMDKPVFEQALMVTPNPFANVINIKARKEMATVYLYNSLGRKMYSADVSAEDAEIQVEQLSQGMYILVVEYTDGKRETRKLLKK